MSARPRCRPYGTRIPITECPGTYVPGFPMSPLRGLGCLPLCGWSDLLLRGLGRLPLRGWGYGSLNFLTRRVGRQAPALRFGARTR
jgi:hypothetical protein